MQHVMGPLRRVLPFLPKGRSLHASGAPSAAGARFKIYTKTGDEGTSSLYNGNRAAKDDAVFWALGETDELNSAVGVAREFLREGRQQQALAGLSTQLEEIQSRLLDVGSAVATPLDTTKSAFKLNRTKFSAEAVQQVESWIDAMDEELPPLTTFILPSGGKAAAFLHMARCVCRRAERRIVPLCRENQVEGSVAVYMNRLSDYFFTAARFAAFKEGRSETTYKKTSEPKTPTLEPAQFTEPVVGV